MALDNWPQVYIYVSCYILIWHPNRTSFWLLEMLLHIVYSLSMLISNGNELWIRNSNSFHGIGFSWQIVGTGAVALMAWLLYSWILLSKTMIYKLLFFFYQFGNSDRPLMKGWNTYRGSLICFPTEKQTRFRAAFNVIRNWLSHSFQEL